MLSISPSIVRFTICARNRHNLADEMKPGLFTTRASCSRIAVAGTGAVGELARDPDDKGGVGTFVLLPLHYPLPSFALFTASLRQLTANRKLEGLPLNQEAVVDRCRPTNQQEQ